MYQPLACGCPSSCGNAKISDLPPRSCSLEAFKEKAIVVVAGGGEEERQYCPFSLRWRPQLHFLPSLSRLSSERKIWNRLRRILLSAFEFTFISRLLRICTLQEFCLSVSPFVGGETCRATARLAKVKQLVERDRRSRGQRFIGTDTSFLSTRAIIRTTDGQSNFLCLRPE